MGTRTRFTGTITTSRPVTDYELEEYQNELKNNGEMFLLFVYNSRIELECIEKVMESGYIEIEKSFLKTLNWMKCRGITLYGRINYAHEDIFSKNIGEGFGAFVVTPEVVTHHKFDFNGLKIVSNII